MAATSSSNARPKYDVFLSFSGADTRKGFTNTLFDFLKTKGIDTFMDDDLSRGKKIESSLMRTIEESMIAVVIFSHKYASSSWCLDELLKINECCQLVLPIFYEVDPYHVQEQLGKFGDEFAKLKRSKSKVKIKKWSDALAYVSTLSGWDLANFRTEIDLIKEVAACIIKNLDSVSRVSPSPGLIGIASLVDDIKNLLNNESTGVQFLGIWGMGGVGKTTVVEVLYHQLSKQFDACYFAANVRHESSYKLVSLRDKIISKILGENFDDGTPYEPPASILWRLQKKVVLIVLDNVSNTNQVATLVGAKTDNWFGPGSKVIVTSRDSGVFRPKDMMVFQVKELSPHYSLRLFCLNAFRQNQPPDGFLELSQQIVDHAKGVPLALNILGSLLYERTMDEWISTLAKLEGSLDMEIEEVLKISYYDLDRNEKMIFLDVACFFKGYDKDRVKDILDACGFSASIGIARLLEKCLVTVSVDNKLRMHDLIQKMGWEIVEQQSGGDFGMRSRFWTPNESYNVLTCYTETKAIEGIFLDMDKITTLDLSPMTFSKMQNLRLLKFEKGPFSFDDFHKAKINMHSDIQFLPNNLRFLHWDGYPCESLPSNFSAENVVELILRDSKLTKLWDGVVQLKGLKKLKILDLQGSDCLTEFPDLSSATNLEKIILDECNCLVEVPTSIQYLRRLYYLSLRGCINLCSLPSLVNVKALRTLDLYGCLKFKKFPQIPEDIEVLNLMGTAVRNWPRSSSFLNNLKMLYVPTTLKSLPGTMHTNSLKMLTLRGCSEVKKFPKIIGSIQKLNLESSGITELPSSIGLLSSLIELSLGFCEKLERLPDNFGQLKFLEKLSLRHCQRLFERPFTLSGLCSIKELCLQECGLTEFPEWLSTLSSLQVLSLSCNYFRSMPENIKQLSLLEILDLNNCMLLRSLPELPCQLNDLIVSNCESLKEASSSFIGSTMRIKPGAANFSLPSYRLCFVGCEGLDEYARRDIVTNARMRIQHMANSRDEDLRFPLRVSLPGNEIPESFHKCEGSYMTVDLPLNWCDSTFMGFLFGVIADVDVVNRLMSFDPSQSITYICEFRNKDDVGLGRYEMSFDFDEGCRLHPATLILQYSGNIYSPNGGNRLCRDDHKEATHAIFAFMPKEFKVSKCGVHLVCAEFEDQYDVNVGTDTAEAANVATEQERDSTEETTGCAMVREIVLRLVSLFAQFFGYKREGPEA